MDLSNTRNCQAIRLEVQTCGHFQANLYDDFSDLWQNTVLVISKDPTLHKMYYQRMGKDPSSIEDITWDIATVDNCQLRYEVPRTVTKQ